MPQRPHSFSGVLDAQVTRDPGRPLVTAYDEADGARVELSVKTYANWVAKTANLLMDEYLLGEGDAVRVELPPHWLGTVFIGAALTAGVALTTDPSIAAHLLVRGPGQLDHAAPDVPVLACSLTPFATRFDRPLPDGVDDFGLLWPGQPDGFGGTAPDPTVTGCRHGDSSHSHDDILGRAEAVAGGWSGDRLLTDANPLTECGTTTFLAALAGGGSLVLVGNPRDDDWPERYDGERVTDLLRSA